MVKRRNLEKEFYQKQDKDWLVKRLLYYSKNISRFDKELQKCKRKLKKVA